MWTHHQKRQRRKHEAAKRHYERQKQATGTAVHGEDPQVVLRPKPPAATSLSPFLFRWVDWSAAPGVLAISVNTRSLAAARPCQPCSNMQLSIQCVSTLALLHVVGRRDGCRRHSAEAQGGAWRALDGGAAPADGGAARGAARVGGGARRGAPLAAGRGREGARPRARRALAGGAGLQRTLSLSMRTRCDRAHCARTKQPAACLQCRLLFSSPCLLRCSQQIGHLVHVEWRSLSSNCQDLMPLLSTGGAGNSPATAAAAAATTTTTAATAAGG